MINRIQLIRNVGHFESVATAANIDLGRLTLIYAENGRGKTTLAAILRSLATGDAIPIVERRRLAAQHPPHVIVECTGDPQAAMFQNGAWGRTLPNMVVFDDEFVDQNLYSGLVVAADHRKNLHELILGVQGVALNRQLQGLIAQVEVHNRNLRQLASAIPIAERGDLTVDQFCELPQNLNVSVEIETAERNLAAAAQQDPIRNTPAFDLLEFPVFDAQRIQAVLGAGIPEIDAAAVERVQDHLTSSGQGAEGWIAQGMQRQAERPQQVSGECVFCAQDLSRSPVLVHYRAFFSAEYQALQRNILEVTSALNQNHNESVATILERAVGVVSERHRFWAQFVQIRLNPFDTALFTRDWRVARDQLVALLARKRASPLDAASFPNEVIEGIQLHATNIASLNTINEQLTQANQAILALKQSAANANPLAIAAELSRLQAVQSRYSPATSPLCTAYLAEKQEKAATVQARDQARGSLEQYRVNVFPRYEAAINRYLQQFNAGFTLDTVAATNSRGGPSCTYNVVINNTAIPVAGGTRQPGDHSFKSTLSAGDRNTLALAFFFASIELDPNIADKTVVIDDPVSSLDEHRSLTTVQEVRRLSNRVAQVVVLSHSKSFLCQIWTGADTDTRVPMQVVRSEAGSTIEAWNVDNDSITEHDRRDAVLRDYLANGMGNERDIAISLRPHMEAFIRVACPEHFPPSSLLGQFRRLCDTRLATPFPILNAQDTESLRDLVEYANRFHHDTNPAYAAAAVNGAELTGFVHRVLAFVKRP